MSRIGTKGTNPERVVRSMLHRLGYRFTVNSPGNRLLPGKPDIVLPKWKTVVFVHGCFWHYHQDCRSAKIPDTRSAWWEEKLEGNRRRDQRVGEALSALQWNVVIVWACELNNREKRDRLTARFPELIEKRT